MGDWNDPSDITRQRGKAALFIQDLDKRRQFIAAQGDAEALAEKNNKSVSQAAYGDMAAEARELRDQQEGHPLNAYLNTKPKDYTGYKLVDKGQERPPQSTQPPSYKKGTRFVPRTGPAILHRGEAVVPAKKARAMRRERSAFFGE